MTPAAGAVDGGQVRVLLAAYRRMARRGRVAAAMGARDVRTPGAALPLALGMYGLVGVLLGAAIVGSATPVLYGLVLHLFTLFAGGLALTIESAEVLYSRVERDVLGHRPIAPATLLVAKGIHLFSFGLLLSAAINVIPALIGIGLKGARPWFPVAHLLASALQTAFVCAAVVFVHGAVGRFVGRERFETFATWAQVGLSAVFVLGYQLAMPLVVRIGDAGAVSPWVLVLAPPGWFASLGAILGGGGGRALLPGTAAGILVTSSLAWLAIRRLSAGLAEGVAALDEAPGGRPKARRAAGRTRPFDALVRLSVRDPVERAAFNLAAAYMARDRETKLRLYPSLSTLLLVPIMGIIRPERSSLGGPAFGLFGLVMIATLSLSVVETLRVSSQHAAADVFRSAPLASAGGLFHGVRKAALFFVALPAGSAMAVLIALTFRGGREGLIAGIPLILAVPTFSLLPGFLGDYLPLSRPVVQGEIGGQTAALMLVGTIAMGGVAAVGFFAFRAGRLVPVVAAETVLLAVIHVAASRAIASRPFATG